MDSLQGLLKVTPIPYNRWIFTVTDSIKDLPEPLLLSCILVAAALYASVGYGGASGYIAVMALFSIDPQYMRPAILCMNIFVALLVFVRLCRQGYLRTRLFLPITFFSVPLAVIGGRYVTTPELFALLVGVSLVVAAFILISSGQDTEKTGIPDWRLILPVGSGLGLISGLTGIGGGIFLSPLLLYFNWATMRESSAIASGFILVNSIAGLLGYVSTDQPWPQGVIWLVVVAVIGGWLGSTWSLYVASSRALKIVLVLILMFSGIRMLILFFG